jgi:hypothetical protein
MASWRIRRPATTSPPSASSKSTLPHAITPLDVFLCADANLCLTAAAVGLGVHNPEVP